MNKFKHLVLAIFTMQVIFLSGCTNNNKNNEINNRDWLIDYSPIHTLGTDNDSFWIDYPAANPNSSQIVSHLPWINESIEEGCVLFVVHKTGCESCQPQADRVIALANKYQEYVVFHDLNIELGGSTEQQAYDSYVYDPDGPPGYIALTGVFTIVKHNESIQYAWHSWERDAEYNEMEEWIKDAIYYWDLYNEETQ